jgi:hypothetical protein
VPLNWKDWAGIAVLVAAGWVLCYAVLRHTLRRAVSTRQMATERQLGNLAARLGELETRMTGLSQIPHLQAAAAPEIETEIALADTEQSLNREEEEVTPEIMAVLAAAAAAFLGKKIRIVSAKRMNSPLEVMSSWSQQGRVFVQASHNLRSRG